MDICFLNVVLVQQCTRMERSFAFTTRKLSSIKVNAIPRHSPGKIKCTIGSKRHFARPITRKSVLNKITGRWIIQQLPWSFPQCCRQPTLNFEEEIQDKKKMTNETQPVWMRVTVDFPSCKNEQETWQQPLNWRLWQNRMNEGSFLIKLPWPLGK